MCHFTHTEEDYDTYQACRFCGYNPCMCGRRQYMTDREYREKSEAAERNRDKSFDPDFGAGG